MNDQPQVAESSPQSVEDRMASFFGAPKAPAAPEPQQEVDEATPLQSADEQPEDGTREHEVEQPEDQPADLPTEEVEWEGERYIIPSKLKPALMKEADYRRKTQELAEVRKATEAERLVLQSTQAFNQQVQPLLSQKAQLQSMKEQARKIDWTSLTTDQKLDLDRELRNIDTQLADIDRDIGAKRQEHDEGFSRAVVQAVQATENYMAQKVPGWSQAAGNALHEYGSALGIPKQKLTAGWFSDPVATHVMWKAQQWDQLQAGKPAVTNKAAKAPPVVRAVSNSARESNTAEKDKVLRQRLKQSGSVDDAVALLRHRMR